MEQAIQFYSGREVGGVGVLVLEGVHLCYFMD
jgi:hypothetical protein